jgi:predicted nucleotidyltransferase
MTRPSIALEQHRIAVRELVQRFRATNPRVFGSVLRQRDTETSDLDLLVDPLPEATLFDLGGLQDSLEQALGVKVDLLTPTELPEKFRAQVLAEAKPV